jgi:protein SCO1/2
MNNQQKIFFVIVITAALLAGFWFGGVSLNDEDNATASHVMLLDAPQKLAIPALQQADGSRFDMHTLEGKWSLLFFGYTNCPDICPATLNTLAQAKMEYIKRKTGQTTSPFPQVIFISVDPLRDNVKALGEYVRYFDKDFIGATGEEKLLRAITVQTYANFMTPTAAGNEHYQVSHSVNLALINPNVELVAVLGTPHTVESILDALKQFQI